MAIMTERATEYRLDAHDPGEVARVAAKAAARVMEAWRIGNAAAAVLVDVSPRSWARMKTGQWAGRMSHDQMLRVSALTGLYKALHLYFRDDLADRWVGLANSGPLFSGRTPLDVMQSGGLPAILEIRAYVDALRGGV
ncbi:uncharacterized protein DUF2384 [Hoeflea marina]|uniref:Uncharacterized protein DUF2384 n=1 Tax=Hoeflea marina TaxID=274592 RepID=A0A317PGT4_9HYPH|nr:antitoxin Xre/MbcA/ParS toxin-binding domain-containing protein [Hoeflea marina]PWV99224.1 uncharacterized protein DUF2384 [Hoeflea marina]